MPAAIPFTLEQRLSEYDEILLGLYEPHAPDEQLHSRVLEVIKYYGESIRRSTYNSKAILESYKLFVDNLIKVKEGALSAEAALHVIEENTYDRKVGIVFYNIAKTLELLFWTAATAAFTTLFLFSGSLAASPLGIAVFLISGASTVRSGANFLQCVNDLKSFGRLNKEDERERHLVTFFKPSGQPSVTSGPDDLRALSCLQM